VLAIRCDIAQRDAEHFAGAHAYLAQDSQHEAKRL
jgi:hypothetical protein